MIDRIRLIIHPLLIALGKSQSHSHALFDLFRTIALPTKDQRQVKSVGIWLCTLPIVIVAGVRRCGQVGPGPES